MATTKFYLDKRSSTPDGTYPLKLAITKKRVASYINLNIRLNPNQWDAKKNLVINHPRKQYLNGFITSQRGNLESFILSLMESGKFGYMSAVDIKKAYVNVAFGDQESKKLFTNNMEHNPIKHEKTIDRFDKYMKLKGLNDHKVTEQLGLSIGTIGKSRKEGRDLSNKVVEKILNFYDDLSRLWLILGEGEMLKSEPIRHIHNVKEGVIATQVDNSPVNKLVNEKDLILLLQKKDEQIDRLLSIIEKISLKQIKI